MAKTWHKRPSEIINMTYEYEAYCFDEACTYIVNQMENKKTPKFEELHNNSNNPGLDLLMK